jgi:hypothetical protein
LPLNGSDYSGLGGGIGIIQVAFKESSQNLIFGLELNSFESFSPTYQDDKYTSYKNVKASVFSINIPVFYRYNFGESKRLFLQVGFSMDLNLFASGSGLISSYGATFQTPTITDQPTDSISLNTKVSLTPRIGVGYKTLINKRYFYLQMDYLYNLSPVILGSSYGTFQGHYLRLNLGMSSKN